jgi:tetratricopeptide (TPR) repeat protein
VAPAPLTVLQSLLAKSLLVRSEGRLTMLETVREYALEQLAAGGEEDAVRRAHAHAFAEQAERADRGLRSRDVGAWLDRVHPDHGNIRAAVRFAVADGDAVTAQRLCAGMWRYWVLRGNLTEGRALVGAAIAAGDGISATRISVLNGAGVLAGEQGDFAAAREHFEATLELARGLGLRDQLARAHANLGNLALYEGDADEAIRLYERSMELWREVGDEHGVSLLTQNLGIAHSGAGNHERAVELLEESVVLARRAADPAHISSTLRSLGRALLVSGADRGAARGWWRPRRRCARPSARRPTRRRWRRAAASRSSTRLRSRSRRRAARRRGPRSAPRRARP